MCIRDRLGHPGNPAGRATERPRDALRPVAALLCTRVVRADAPPRMRVPVSYTHLRAHETSAHL
eukprot:13077753-Alexandrium_andersonii.AAC.1